MQNQTTPTACPTCQSPLYVNRYECPNCGTAFTGNFYAPAGTLEILSSSQQEFVLAFIRCEGKINRMEVELGISYPTIRSRLDEIVRLVSDNDLPAPHQNRLRILSQVATGKITAEQAAQAIKGE